MEPQIHSISNMQWRSTAKQWLAFQDGQSSRLKWADVVVMWFGAWWSMVRGAWSAIHGAAGDGGCLCWDEGGDEEVGSEPVWSMVNDINDDRSALLSMCGVVLSSSSVLTPRANSCSAVIRFLEEKWGYKDERIGTSSTYWRARCHALRCCSALWLNGKPNKLIWNLLRMLSQRTSDNTVSGSWLFVLCSADLSLQLLLYWCIKRWSCKCQSSVSLCVSLMRPVYLCEA
jgi:hypothetical protein